MKKGHLIFFLAASFILTSCEFKCEVGNKQEQSPTVTGQILNNIQLNSREVTVNRAFLAKENGDLVPSDNTVALGEKINLSLNVDGWKETDGKVYLGASEVITDDKGNELLNSGDLFSTNETGVDPADAKMITLKAVITQEPTTPVDHYVVNFRVWDKKGNGEITGKYNFKVK